MEIYRVDKSQIVKWLMYVAVDADVDVDVL